MGAGALRPPDPKAKGHATRRDSFLRWSSAAPAVSLRGGGNEGLIASKRLRGTGLLTDDSIASRVNPGDIWVDCTV